MARKSKSERMTDLHADALEQFQESYDATAWDREQALKARRFVNIRGAQWDWADGQFDNKMMLEIDHVSGEIIRIANEYRKNRISAEFMPSDGTEADDLADACASRYRADTQDAQGREARDTSFYGALEGGMGGMRLRAEYERDSDQHQRICLEPVNDAESTLFFDANAKRKDKSDAKHAFLIAPWTRRAFVREYGEECASWPQPLAGKFTFPWFGSGLDLVYVAEYFVKEVGTETFRRFEGFGGEIQEHLEADLDGEGVEELLATGFVEIDPRTDKYDRIQKYVMNGAKILSGPELVPGRNIPLVPQYGYWKIINHVEHFRGHVLKLMDGQIVYNIQVSKVGETAAASGIEKPIFLAEQIKGHEIAWQNDNIENNAFMTINAIRDVSGQIMPSGPIAFTKSPDVAPAVAALIQLTKQDIADQLGNQSNTEQLQPNTSGISMELAQGKSDMRSAAFIDGAAEAETRVAEIWLGMASEIYVEMGRKLKTTTEDGKRSTVEIGKKILDTKTGELKAEIDFSRAKFDVVTDVGPTSASRRMSIVRTLFSMMQYATDPADQKKLMAYGMMNMEGEGLADMRADARRTLIAMGVVKPTKEEEEAAAAEAAAQQPAPDPNAILADAMATESRAKAGKATADAALAEARTQETQANTAKTLAQIPIAQQESALKTAQAIAGELNAGQPNNGL